MEIQDALDNPAEASDSAVVPLLVLRRLRFVNAAESFDVVPDLSPLGAATCRPVRDQLNCSKSDAACVIVLQLEIEDLLRELSDRQPGT